MRGSHEKAGEGHASEREAGRDVDGLSCSVCAWRSAEGLWRVVQMASTELTALGVETAAQNDELEKRWV